MSTGSNCRFAFARFQYVINVGLLVCALTFSVGPPCSSLIWAAKTGKTTSLHPQHYGFPIVEYWNNCRFTCERFQNVTRTCWTSIRVPMMSTGKIIGSPVGDFNEQCEPACVFA